MQDFAAFFEVLRRELGNPAGTLYEGISLDSANRLWLSKSIDKKFSPIDTTQADAKCLELFLERNSKCKAFSLKPTSKLQCEVVEGVKKLFYDLVFAGPELYFGLEDISQAFGVGPGASLKASSFDFYSKVWGGPLSSTNPTLYKLYLQSLSSHTSWGNAETSRYSSFGVSECVGNRLSFVPKTSIISRSTCTEPSLNMLFQKGIGSCIEDGLRRIFKIDLSFQPEINRKLARAGSIDGSLSTIDLSSASDSIALGMLREILPLDLLKWLLLSRSPCTVLPDGTCQELFMVSSMGNGFTFPLQTYLFASIVVATYHALGIKPKYDKLAPKNWGVYGDDIIVLSDAYEETLRSLELFGFLVNADKSFNHGSFRESCGGDFYRGHDIRGVYLKSLNTDADVYSAINRLVRWSSRTGIFLPETVTILRGMLKGKALYIPFLDSDAEGLKVPHPPVDARTKRNGAISYLALVRKSLSVKLPNSPTSRKFYPVKNGKRTKVFFNPDGLKLSVIAGFIRDERVMIRELDHETFKVRRRTTNNWYGILPPVDANLWLNHLNSLDQGLNVTPEPFLRGAPTPGSLFSPGCDWFVASAIYFP